MVFIRPKDIDYDDVASNEEFSIMQKMVNKGFKPLALDAPELCCKLSMPPQFKKGNIISDGLSEEQTTLIQSII